MIYISTFLLILICIGVYHYKQDILSPALIQPMIWVVMLGGAALLENTFFTLSTSTSLLYPCGSLLFLFGFWLADGLASHQGRYVTLVQVEKTFVFRNTLFLLVLVMLPFYVKAAYGLATTGPVDDLATNLRYSLTESSNYEEGYGLLGYGVTFSLFLVVIESTYYSSLYKRRLILSAMVALVFCVLSTGRTYIFIFLLCLFVPLIINGKIKAGKGVMVLLGIFFVLFFVYALTLAKDGGGGLDAFVQVVSVYLYGAIFAFDKLTLSLTEYDGGSNLFRTFIAIASKFDSSISVPSIIEEYQFVPFATNVYTVFGKSFRDFGYSGTALYMLFIGYIQGHIYVRAKAGSTYYKIAFVFSLYPLLMQFFQDQYFGLLSTWVQIFLLIMLFKYVTRRGAEKHWIA